MSEKVDKIIKALNKTYEGSIVSRMGDKINYEVDSISTGVISLDLALGVGGFAKGRLIELIGSEAGGKTTLALHATTEVQKTGKLVLFLDVEHSFHPGYAQSLGVDLKELLFCQPDTEEQAFEIIEALVETGEIGLVVLDSVAALSPKAEVDGDSGDSIMGVKARIMGQHIRKITPMASRSGTILLYINQWRDKLGVMFGSPRVPTGGNSLKYQASVRLDMSKIANITEGEKVIGVTSRIKVMKNKLSNPFTEAEFDIKFGKGVDKISDLVAVGVIQGIVTKSGSWFSINGEQIGQGRNSVIEYLSDPDNLASFQKLIRKE